MADSPKPSRTRPAPADSKPGLRAVRGLPADIAAMLQRLQQVEAQREDAKVHQLAFWPDDKRAMPSDFIACALFASIQQKDAALVDGAEIASANGLRILFKGRRLTQVHADVWQGIMHLARRAEQGTKVRFGSRTFLRLIGRHTGKSQRDQLHRWITDLVATNVEIIDTTNKRRYFGSLLPHGCRDDADPTGSAYVVEINHHLCKLFSAGFSTVDWDERKRLAGKWLALWLHHYFSKFTRPVAVSDLHRLSGSDAQNLKHFRAKLRGALGHLQAVGVLGGWRIDPRGDILSIERSSEPTPAQTPAGVAARPLGIAAREPAPPPVSEAAKARYAQLYRRDDVDACVSAWHDWLTRTRRTAERWGVPGLCQKVDRERPVTLSSVSLG